MKKMYSFFGLEIHLIVLSIFTFSSYLVPICYKVNQEKIPVYGFGIIGSISIILIIVALILLFMKNIIPKKLKELWKYFVLAFVVFLFLNIVLSVFYSKILTLFESNPNTLFYVGPGFIVQFIAFLISFFHMYHIYNDDYILFENSNLKRLLSNN